LCGTNGLTNFVTLGGFDVRAPEVKLGLYIITVITLIAVYALCKYVCFSRLGRLMVAVRDSESRLRFAGYEPVKLKLFAFTAGAVIAGIGGMLYTPQNGIITPFKMEPAESILMVIWVAVGGRGTLSGAVVGALIVNALYSWLTSNYPQAWPFVEGGLFISVTLLFPDGVIGYWLKLTHRETGPPVGFDVEPPSTPPALAGQTAGGAAQ
jgi:urea transport system permease protein